ncbi:ABC transporter, ATP-binding protein [Dorea sp. D27]|nr:ABC transporter ATP-binding protein [Dorea sp. D27]KMZ52611.1 ABC transporter, ATP-binding protein [Dorea sp. D27]
MLVKMEHVKKHYKGFELDCSLQVQEGRVTGLIGPNGAGKSTAFKAILNLIDVDAGGIAVLGKANDRLTQDDREQIGVVLSDSGFSGYLSVKDIIPVMNSLYRRFDRAAFENLCKEFNIPFDKKIKEFSTGMKAKLQVISAMCHDARLLIMDEPTAGLDVIARDELLDLLRGYMEPGDRAILISSHISSDLEGLCDDLYMIDGGKIILHEETDVLLDEYGVLKLTDEQYEKLDKEHILAWKKEGFGVSCLTAQKQFYMENYPGIVIEKGSIDKAITIMIRGEA